MSQMDQASTDEELARMERDEQERSRQQAEKQDDQLREEYDIVGDDEDASSEEPGEDRRSE